MLFIYYVMNIEVDLSTTTTQVLLYYGLRVQCTSSCSRQTLQMELCAMHQQSTVNRVVLIIYYNILLYDGTLLVVVVVVLVLLVVIIII